MSNDKNVENRGGMRCVGVAVCGASVSTFLFSTLLGGI